MPRRRHRRLMVGAAAIVLVALGSGVGLALSGGGTNHSGGRAGAAATATTTAAAPTAADVAAARACQAFTVYLADAGTGTVPKADGEALVNDADALLTGAAKDQAANLPLPKWAHLGANLLSSAEDVVKHDSTSLQTDGALAAQECQTVPAAAARAGGYVRGSG